MARTFALAVALVSVAIVATPASAVTSEEKKETCKVGAESQQLQGAKRDAFIKKCMTNANYEPAARKDALKKKPASAAKPAAAAPAAEPEETEKPQ